MKNTPSHAARKAAKAHMRHREPWMKRRAAIQRYLHENPEKGRRARMAGKI